MFVPLHSRRFPLWSRDSRGPRVGWRKALATRLGGEGGFSLVEMTVALMLLGIVGSIFYPTLVSTLAAEQSVKSESESVDDLRLALTDISRELRSSLCVNVPAYGGGGVPSTGDVLEFSTYRPDGTLYGVRYDVTADGVLQRTVDTTAPVTNFDNGEEPVRMADDVLVSGLTFTHVVDRRSSITITMSIAFHDGSTREFSTSIAGRNAWNRCV